MVFENHKIFYWKQMRAQKSWTFTLCSRNCEVKAWLCLNLLFCRHLDFTWNQILINSNSLKMSFSAILELLNCDFTQFEQCFNSQIYQNFKLRISKIVKRPFLWFKFLPKLISCKIEWQLNSWISTLWALTSHF